MVSGHDSHVQLVKESRVVDHSAKHGLRGLVSVFSVRYTTARHTAEAGRGRRLLEPRLPDATALPHRHDAARRRRDCRPPRVPRGGGEAESRRNFSDFPAAHRHDLRLAVRTTCWPSPAIGPHFESRSVGACEVTGAEILHAAQHESAVTLSDALLRRTAAGSAGHPGRDAIERATAIMGDALGWDASRRRAEVDAVDRIYDVAARDLSHFSEGKSVIS